MSRPLDRHGVDLVAAMATMAGMTTDSFSTRTAGRPHHPADVLQPTARPTGLAGRQGPHYLPAEADLKVRLVADWQLVKRARFHAADRLERCNGASLFTLSMVALYGGLVTVFVLIFRDDLSAHARNVCDWVAAVANWLTLTFSLTEQIKDYGGQSRALHTCAQKVNELRRRLQMAHITDPHQLNPYLSAYEVCIAECGPNHSHLDYEIARLSGSRPVDGLTAASAARRLGRLRLKSWLATYAVYIVMCLAPALAGLAAWLVLPAHAAR